MPLLIEIHHDTVRLTGDRGATVLSVKLDVFITALAQCVERAVFPGRLIDGVRFVRTLGPYTVVCLELPHQVRTVQWLTDDSQAAFGPGAHYQQVRLAFPYILVIVTFWDGALTGQQQLFYRRTPLTSADDTLCFPNLYNVADGYGQVCWVCLQKLHTLVTVPWDEKLQAIVAHLWSAFNRSSEVMRATRTGARCAGSTGVCLASAPGKRPRLRTRRFTVGDLTAPQPSFSTTFVASGQRFQLPPDMVLAGYARPRLPAPARWLARLTCHTYHAPACSDDNHPAQGRCNDDTTPARGPAEAG